MGHSCLDEKIKQRLFEDSVLSIYDIPDGSRCVRVDASEKIYTEHVILPINKKRTKEIIKMRLCGMSYAEIAVFMGVSPQRIYQICATAVKKIKNNAKEEKTEIAKLLSEGVDRWNSFNALQEDIMAEKEKTRQRREADSQGHIF